MDASTRSQRLEVDHSTLEALHSESTLFEFEPADGSAGRHLVRFFGRGLGPLDTLGRPAVVERHEVELGLPFQYPQQPPDLRWLTPLLHPNVSFSGLVEWDALQLPWTPEMGLDVICERLWDIARGAMFSLDAPSNETALPWYDAASPLALPLDDRPLRNRAAFGSNVIRYRRAGDQWHWPVARDILFIGEDTPLPAFAEQLRERSPTSEQDVLYIGPE